MVSGYILFLLGLIVYFFKPKYVPLYYLLWATMVFVFPFDLLFPMTFEESAQVGHVHSTNYIWLCGLLTILRNINKWDSDNYKIVFVLFLLFTFVFVVGFLRGTLIPFQGWLRTYFCFVPLWIIIKSGNIDFKSYGKYVVLAICIEFFLVSFQTIMGIFPSYSNGQYAENGAVNIVGTFKRYNDFADNQSLLVLSLLYIYNKDPKFISRPVFFVFFVVGLILVTLAGARTELIALVVSLSLTIWGLFPKWRKKIVIGGIVAVLLLISGYNISLEKDTTSSANDSNYNRQRELLDFLEGDMDVAEESTFLLTVFLVREYISYPDKILTGPGLLFTSSNGYHGMVMKDYLAADSFLALFLCETGIIGYFLLFSFLYLIVKHSKEKLFPMTMLMYLFLVSITDYGLFQGQSAIYWLFVVYYNQDRK